MNHLYSPRRSILFPALIALLILAVRDSAAESEAGNNSGSKDLTLFLGLDVTVNQPGGAGPVQGVVGTRVVYAVNGVPRQVDYREIDHFDTARVPKVSRAAINVQNATAERIYTPATDPALRATTVQAEIAAFMQERADRVSRAEYANTSVQLAAQAAVANGGPGAADIAQTAAASQADTDREVFRATQGAVDPLKIADNIRFAPDSPFDAIEVRFEVSAAEPVDDAYAVFLAVVRAPGHPKMPASVVGCHRLPRISATPRKVSFDQRGLPPGFILDSYELHVYSHGRELATNLSANRVDLSRTEAHQYFVLQYVMAQRNATKPPTLVPELLAKASTVKLSDALGAQEIDVDVNRDGKVTRIATTQPSAPPLDATIETLIRDACFYPALVKGVATDSGARMAIGEFVR